MKKNVFAFTQIEKPVGFKGFLLILFPKYDTAYTFKQHFEIRNRYL